VKTFAKSRIIHYFLQKITRLEATRQSRNAEDWANHLPAKGKYAFTLGRFRADFQEQSDTANKFTLKRLVDKEQIISINKGYYLIIPPQYRSKGILPPTLFLDAFMKELDRPYYLALLNAAAHHGASHQQAQEFFVVTGFPLLRPMQKKGLKINYISKKEIPEPLLDTRKTEAGYLKISNPALTATDLIQYAKRVGGINRVVTVLSELAESIQPDAFNSNLLQHVPVTGFQRLGYLLDKIFDNQPPVNAFYMALQINKASRFRIPWKASAPAKGFTSDERWKVIVNSVIDLDRFPHYEQICMVQNKMQSSQSE
jgi:predicted transcriptional regulator of viral defense system